MGGERDRSYYRTMMERVSTYAQRLVTRWHVLRADEDGASMVEYALLAALIAIVVIAGVSFFGNRLDGAYQDIGSSMVDAGM